MRDLAASIVPKIAQADWPSDWPGFLEELSNVISHSSDVVEIISALRVLRGIVPYRCPPSGLSLSRCMRVNFCLSFLSGTGYLCPAR